MVVHKEHADAVNGISWAPAVPGKEKRGEFVTGGSDNKIMMWSWQDNKMFKEGEIFEHGGTAHDDWVRDVDWLKSAPSAGLTADYIASVSEDRSLRIWRRHVDEKGWRVVFEHREDSVPAWRCSWSPISCMLAVSFGNNSTRVYQQTASSGADKEEWVVV